MAFLNRSLEIVFRDERPETVFEQTFKYDGGIIDFVKHLNASKEPLFSNVVYYTDDEYKALVAERKAKAATTVERQ